ncbi:helix-turn-helix domain-containing protein [Algoriphagus resistens]|uniref:helix-turn-helix domain-containing protein n=1 Tax=Algoriphagus resistens TaxID=1750590 RepID=UPI000A947871|nr:AraC family transcriptional regulator [Algoriphagus resistens]
MFYQKIAPCEPLKELVSHYWAASWDSRLSHRKSIYYTIANTLTDITFAFNDSSSNSQLLFTAVQVHTERPNQIKVPGFNHLVGASLFSHAIPELLDRTPDGLKGEFIPLKDVLGADADRLAGQLEDAPNLSCQIQVLNNFFYQRLNPKKDLDGRMAYAIQLIQSNQGQKRIPELASACSLSQKQFGRIFKAYTGFNPKLFSRIVRFEAVVKSGKTWSSQTEAAHELGYHDQAHFIREFKSFTGLIPKDFWKLSEA